MALDLKHKRYTYDDYCKLPDDERVELINGALLMSPAPNWQHQSISGKLFYLLYSYVTKRKLGKVSAAPTDVFLSDFDVVQPDILFVAKNRLNIIGEPCVKSSPDFVIEILSPPHEARDTVEKKQLYEKYRIPEYWIVDPKTKSVTVFLLDGKLRYTEKTYQQKDVLKSRMVRGFKLRVRDLFKE